MMNVYLGCVPLGWSGSESSHGIQWTNEYLIPRVDWSVPLVWCDATNLL